MTRLVFNADKIARTTTRSEWREIDRWRRVTQRELSKHDAAMIAMLREPLSDLAAFGQAQMRADVIQSIVNPPIMVYPPL